MKTLLLFIFFSSFSIFAQIAPEWEYTFHLNSNNQQNISTILTDNNNNFIFLASSNEDTNQVSGGYIMIGKVSNAGTLLWRRTYSRPGLDSGDFPISMVQDIQGNIYILDNSHGYNTGIDFGIIKYGPNGNFLWDYFYTTSSGIDSDDEPAAITLDNQSNCYVTGYSHHYILNYDSITTLKLNSGGALQWVRKYASYRVRLNAGECIIADNQSNVYVGGSVNDTAAGFLNAALLKYNSAGVLQWAKFHNGVQNNADCIFDMKFDNAGNIIATGATDDVYNFDSASVLLQKYSPSGNLLWSQVYHTINPGSELSKKLLIDNNDDIFVLGQTQLYPYTSNSSTFLLKYNSSGSLQWDRRYGDFFNIKTYPYNIGFDNSRNILISGFEIKYGKTNLMLLKYDNTSGNRLWTYLYNRTGNSTDFAYYSGYSSDNLYIAGSSNNDLMLLKMQPTNTFTTTFQRSNLFKPILDSQYTYDTVMLNSDVLPPSAIIRYINIKIDTILHSAMGDLEITLKNGSIEDTLLYRRGGPLDNMINTNLNDTSAVNICNSALPPFTGFYAPCRSLTRHMLLPGQGPWILKIYDRKAPDTGSLRSWSLTLTYEIPIGIQPISTEIPGEFSLFQNYPNPFNPVTRIKYSIPESSQAKLVIYDMNGKEVYTLVNEWHNTGIYEYEFNASNLASGVYFYQLITNNFTETKKMVLIK